MASRDGSLMPQLPIEQVTAAILNLRDTVTVKQKREAVMARKMAAAREIENRKIDNEEV